MNLSEVSQIIAGLCLKKNEEGQRRCDPGSVTLASLEKPYDDIVRALKEGKEDHEVIQLGGLDAYRLSLMAADSVPDTVGVGQYLDLLNRTSLLTRAGAKLQRASTKMLRGEDVELVDIEAIIKQLRSNTTAWVSMDLVEAESDMWIPTYWGAWDEYFGGIPKYGLIIVAGPPGTGKSSAVVKLFDSMTINKLRCAMMSLEMTKEVVKMRWMEINPALTLKQTKRLLVTDLNFGLDEACSAISQVFADDPELYAVFIDYADLLQKLESTETSSQIYIKLSMLARDIGKPIFLLSQLSRNYVGGIPHVTDIRYSGLAEAAASMIVLLYNPDQLFVDMGKSGKDSKLPYVEDMAYLIEGKSRFGYHMGGPGAVRLAWNRAGGWGDSGQGWERL